MCVFSPTWDVLGPAYVDHQLPVGEVTQRGEGFDVAVGYRGVGHGVDLLRLGHQQVGHDLVICKAAKGNWVTRAEKRETGSGLTHSGTRTLTRTRTHTHRGTPQQYWWNERHAFV